MSALLLTGALLVRTFKPREHQGSPVVLCALEHPATGEFLLLAGTTLHEFDGAPWTAGPTDIPAVRCLAVDGAGRIWRGGGDQLGFAERAATGQERFPSLSDRPREPPRRPTVTSVGRGLRSPENRPRAPRGTGFPARAPPPFAPAPPTGARTED